MVDDTCQYSRDYQRLIQRISQLRKMATDNEWLQTKLDNLDPYIELVRNMEQVNFFHREIDWLDEVAEYQKTK
jgi:predicted dithiol-disulfide oxidoreductase (DUF899 family)